MEEKLIGPISKAVISGATFTTKSVITPSYINFFFGNNGSGKTSVADELFNANSSQITYNEATSRDNFEILRYNQDYVSENLHKISDINGIGPVFLLSKENMEIQNKINKKYKAISIKDESKEINKSNESTFIEQKNKEIHNIQTLIYNSEKEIRDKFSGFILLNSDIKPISNFVKIVTSFQNSRNIPPTMEEVDNYYKDFVVNASSNEYLLIKELDDITLCDYTELLKEPLIDSSNTQFKDFLKSINGENWFMKAHALFSNNPHSKGKCPYCQRPLNDDFEEIVASSFDQTYTNKINAIQNELSKYMHETERIITQLESYKKIRWALKTEYESFVSKLDVLKITINANLTIFNNKINHPSLSFEISSVSGILNELNACIANNNKTAIDINATLGDKEKAKKKCREMFFSALATKCSEELKKIKNIENEVLAKKEETINLNGQIDTEIEALKNEIKDLKSQMKEMKSFVEEINELLVKSGFTGFKLKEINDGKGVQVIRESTGKPADKLSEGEKNFLLFLYFYYSVKGTSDESGDRKNKIVIIDDPVTSMDSQSLFIIASLVKYMITVCANNCIPDAEETDEDYIKQIFVLSHNPYFFREVSDCFLEYYSFVNFYEIKKTNNISSISDPKITNDPDDKLKFINTTPVKNKYNHLWSQFNSSGDVITVAMAAKQILTHYFIEVCRYKGDYIKQKVLDEKQQELNSEDYRMIKALISYLTVSIEDDFYYDFSNSDIDSIHDNLEKIFNFMNYSQHYKEMRKIA